MLAMNHGVHRAERSVRSCKGNDVGICDIVLAEVYVFLDGEGQLLDD